MTLNISEINVGDEVVAEIEGGKPLTSGLYHCFVKYCYLDGAKESSAQCLKFGLEIKDYGFKEIPIWIISKSEEPISMGVGLVGAFTGFLGLQRKIDNSIFKDMEIEIPYFNKDANREETKKEVKSCAVSYHNKEIGVMIGVEHKINPNTGNVYKQYSINGFYKLGTNQSYTEYKNQKEGKIYLDRLAYLQDKEAKSKEKCENTQSSDPFTNTNTQNNKLSVAEINDILNDMSPSNNDDLSEPIPF